MFSESHPPCGNAEPKTPIYHYNITTWCPYQKDMITLTVESSKKFSGILVRGKPIKCSKSPCKFENEDRCYLKAIQIEARRDF